VTETAGVSDLAAAMIARRSYSRVTSDVPSHEELVALVAAAGRVADHSSLQPWRIIELRGDARVRLGDAFVEASGEAGPAAAKLAAKPLRAPVLLAIVAVRRQSEKVPHWEQDAVTAGVAHMLSLLLDDAGWGVMWRTGHLTRTKPVKRMHGLAKNERLLGWLYVGGIPDQRRAGTRKPIDGAAFLSVMD
jgi:nitroreductase